MKQICPVIIPILSSAGCAPLKITPPADLEILVSGKLLFDENIDFTGIDSSAILAIDETMKDYVKS